MTQKILVADDSQTIQKVIQITLANSNYELEKAISFEELEEKLGSSHFDLLLLDYNLTDKLSAKDLIAKVKGLKEGLPILAMLGTFDSLSDPEMNELGIEDKITKPFESAKFTSKIENILSKEKSAPAPKKVRSEETKRKAKEILFDETPVETELQLELDSWNMSVPSVIGKDSTDSPIVPSVIEASTATEQQVEKEINEHFPDNSDLEYPDMSSPSPSPVHEPKSKLIPLSELANEAVGDKTDPAIVVETTPKEELEKEIFSNISPEDFWASDELEKSTPVEKIFDPDATSRFRLADLKEEKPAPKTLSISPEELEKIIRPIVEESLRVYMKESVEKIAWEVIPDLAENLIREQLKEIAKSVD